MGKIIKYLRELSGRLPGGVGTITDYILTDSLTLTLEQRWTAMLSSDSRVIEATSAHIWLGFTLCLDKEHPDSGN